MIIKNGYFNTPVMVSLAVSLCCLPLGVATNNCLVVIHAAAGKEVVTGIPFGSHKITTGIARIVKSSADLKKVNTGDIIVTVMTQEGWVATMKKSSGIITNLGDSTCHAALYGKNNNIPVVVGACNATEKIKDGHPVVLDCSHGIVAKVYHEEVQQNPVKEVHLPIVQHNNFDNGHYGGKELSSPSHSGSVIPVDRHTLQRENSHQKVIKNITLDEFQRNAPYFLSYVSEVQDGVNWRKWIGESAMLAFVRKREKCNEFTIKCIPIIYDICDKDPHYIKSIAQKIDIEFVNILFEQANQKPGDKDWLARVTHAEHIKRISLPHGVNREELIEHPEKYKKMIDEKKIDAQQRHVLILSGLFVRYCLFEKKIRH